MNLLLAINKQNLIDSLTIGWKGMLAIFVVMTLIFLVITLLNTFTSPKKRKKLKEDLSKFIGKFKKRGGTSENKNIDSDAK